MLRKIVFFSCLLVLSLWALWQVSRIESFQIVGTLISEVDTEKPVLALTFDDGPTTKFTPQILDSLAAHNVQATFFVNGLPLSKKPEIGARILAEGHELANHSYTHKRMVFMPPWQVRREITRTDTEIRKLGYKGEIHFRPPYGGKLLFLPLYLARHDRPTIMWSMAPEETVPMDQDAKALAEYVVGTAKSGDIILLHPMFSSGARTREALPDIISGLRAAGFKLVTLNALLAET